MHPAEENLGPCWICNKDITRGDDNWRYFKGLLVHKYHDGVEEWFNGALKMAEAKLNEPKTREIIHEIYKSCAHSPDGELI